MIKNRSTINFMTKKLKTKNSKSCLSFSSTSSITEDKDNDSKAIYYFENGYRLVHPYYFTYSTYVKQRWLNRTLLDVFVSEFKELDSDYYKGAISKGLIKVDDETVEPEYPLNDNQRITHKIHRHEPKVKDKEINFIFKDDNSLTASNCTDVETLRNFNKTNESYSVIEPNNDLLKTGNIYVIEKPSGIPVHPTARYNNNSILKILENENNLKINIVNRLDRLTSGVLMLPTKSSVANYLATLIQTHQLTKIYICEVEGEFIKNQTVECKLPLLTKSYTTGEQMVDFKKGKETTTIFEFIEYNQKLNRSLIKAQPITGRTHQIRVHAKELGHPIVNDPIYNQNVPKNLSSKGESFEKCNECINSLDYYHNYDNDIEMHLHAYRYSYHSSDKKGFLFQTKIPDWAVETYTVAVIENAIFSHKNPNSSNK